VTRPFCYSVSVILWFYQPFLRFHRALQWLIHLLLQWLSYFLIPLCHVAVTQSFCDTSVFFEIWSDIFLILSDILKISLSHSYGLLSHLYHLQPTVESLLRISFEVYGWHVRSQQNQDNTSNYTHFPQNTTIVIPDFYAKIKYSSYARSRINCSTHTAKRVHR
jgi:hypothetical protein